MSLPGDDGTNAAANDNGASPPRSGRPCPICGRPATIDFRPFCSKRCADVDLHRWLGEGYRVPGELDDERSPIPDVD